MGKKQLALVIGILAVVLGIVLTILYFQIQKAGDMWPHEKKTGSLTFDIEKLEKEIAALRTEVAKIDGAKEKLEAIRIEYDLATSVLPRESSPDQLLAAIRTKAHESEVIPIRVTPRVGAAQSSRRGPSAFEEWSFTLEILGNYDQIATFINKMEEFQSADASRVGSAKRFFRVSDIQITAERQGQAALGGADPTSVIGHKCTLVMQTYRYTGSE